MGEVACQVAPPGFTNQIDTVDQIDKVVCIVSQPRCGHSQSIGRISGDIAVETAILGDGDLALEIC
jgi:hypothetical protein